MSQSYLFWCCCCGAIEGVVKIFLLLLSLLLLFRIQEKEKGERVVRVFYCEYELPF